MLKPENGMEKFYRLIPVMERLICFMLVIMIILVAITKPADSVFQIYQQKYPDDVYGWYLAPIQKKEWIQL